MVDVQAEQSLIAVELRVLGHHKDVLLGDHVLYDLLDLVRCGLSSLERSASTALLDLELFDELVDY